MGSFEHVFVLMTEIVWCLEESSLGSNPLVTRMILWIQTNLCFIALQWLHFELFTRSSWWCGMSNNSEDNSKHTMLVKSSARSLRSFVYKVSIFLLFHCYSCRLQFMWRVWNEALCELAAVISVFYWIFQLDFHYSSQWNIVQVSFIIESEKHSQYHKFKILQKEKFPGHYKKSTLDLFMLTIHWLVLNPNNCSCCNI